jgi:hypothetical protein
MSGKVISLNDEQPSVTKIRRDQHKKIQDIVTTNAKFPIVALGLVRDYIKNCSASQVVKAVTFSQEAEPKHIIVHTIGSGQTQADILGTQYYFQIQKESRISAPTL